MNKYFIIIVLSLLVSCRSSKTLTDNMDTIPPSTILNEKLIGSPMIAPKAIIYKTVKDFSGYVPVTMNAEKTKIVSYPAPSDIFYQGRLAKPTALKDGYWLDNRGVNANTVFTDYTYEEYAALKHTPGLEEIYSRILEKNPFIEIIDCGLRLNIQSEREDVYWNNVIDSGFADCTRIRF